MEEIQTVGEIVSINDRLIADSECMLGELREFESKLTPLSADWLRRRDLIDGCIQLEGKIGTAKVVVGAVRENNPDQTQPANWVHTYVMTRKSVKTFDMAKELKEEYLGRR